MNTPQIKIQDLLTQLDFVQTASLIHACTEALRHSCGLARCFADLGIIIPLLHEDDDFGWLKDNIQDIKDKYELVDLVLLASFQLQTLS